MPKPNAKARLKEAVEAMRNIKGMPAAQWERTYPTFVAAINTGTLTPCTGDKWGDRVAAMNIELNLRTAEFLFTAIHHAQNTRR